jgi:hypothetical protein
LLAYQERKVLIGEGVAKAVSRPTMLSEKPTVARMWSRFTESDVPTLLVLSNPQVGNDETCQAAPAVTPAALLPKKVDGPCPDEYTGMGEAVAMALITNLFRDTQQTLILKQSRMVTADDIKHYNLILLGGRKVNVWTQRLGNDVNLNATPEDLAALASDPNRKYETLFDRDTRQLIKDRASITLRRHASTGHWILFLFGNHTQGTQAAAEATIDEHFLSKLQWPTGAQFPDSFRILLGVPVNDGIPQAPNPVAVRVP